VGIELFRIDERLIHGQVVVGWGGAIRVDRILVVDDSLAGSPWEQDLYLLGLPPSVSAEFCTVDQARQRLPEWRQDQQRTILLTRDAATMTRLGTGGLLNGAEVNVGGLHHAPGRRMVLPYVYLSEAETAALGELAGTGARISARDLPGSRRVPLEKLLGKGEIQ
jgi:mannose/fructose/N-acetylgalactosamine-specific phosphotransferase system component IIB